MSAPIFFNITKIKMELCVLISTLLKIASGILIFFKISNDFIKTRANQEVVCNSARSTAGGADDMELSG